MLMSFSVSAEERTRIVYVTAWSWGLWGMDFLIEYQISGWFKILIQAMVLYPFIMSMKIPKLYWAKPFQLPPPKPWESYIVLLRICSISHKMGIIFTFQGYRRLDMKHVAQFMAHYKHPKTSLIMKMIANIYYYLL